MPFIYVSSTFVVLACYITLKRRQRPALLHCNSN